MWMMAENEFSYFGIDYLKKSHTPAPPKVGCSEAGCEHMGKEQEGHWKPLPDALVDVSVGNLWLYPTNTGSSQLKLRNESLKKARYGWRTSLKKGKNWVASEVPQREE